MAYPVTEKREPRDYIRCCSISHQLDPRMPHTKERNNSQLHKLVLGELRKERTYHKTHEESPPQGEIKAGKVRVLTAYRGIKLLLHHWLTKNEKQDDAVRMHKRNGQN